MRLHALCLSLENPRRVFVPLFSSSSASPSFIPLQASPSLSLLFSAAHLRQAQPPRPVCGLFPMLRSHCCSGLSDFNFHSDSFNIDCGCGHSCKSNRLSPPPTVSIVLSSSSSDYSNSPRCDCFDNVATESSSTRWSGASELAQRLAHVHRDWRQRGERRRRW